MKLKLIERKPLFTDVESFIFEPEKPIQWQPGQYMHYLFPHESEDDRGHERWFTISAAPYENHLAITTRFTDKEGSSFKHALKAMKVGDYIEADGPKGNFLIDESANRHVLIAGGIGITPYRSQLLQLDHDGKDLNIELFYANRDQNLVFGQELAELEAKHPNFHITEFIGDRRIQENDLKPFLNDPQTVFYLSGPRPLVENYEHLLKSLAVPEERIKTDYFPGY
jgi:ferredoxin-NADP reductase